ncbi:STE3-domain-containing protein [Peniophora sp. CONT]|nr:STE3-domain-containing protein [Peniophora sp. CONT]
MSATDPTYPFLPIMCILASVLLLSVLLNGFIRQNWNTSVAFLCFWLLVDNIINAVNAIAWSDKFTVKFYIYCDIATHLQVISGVAQPMTTLLLTRRLFLIASLRSVELDSKAARRWNMAVEWALGLVVPLVAGGPIYYAIQSQRFQVLEVFGCQYAVSNNALGFSILFLSLVLAPLISVTIYYPKIVWVFYLHGRDVDRFLRSNNSVSRLNYFRVLALASIDILVTLPVNSTILILTLWWTIRGVGRLPFYPGWDTIHSDWAPVSASYEDMRALPGELAPWYVTCWSAPVLAFITFALFGLTADARASYCRGFCAIARRFGWDPTRRRRERSARSALGSIQFGVQATDISPDVGVRTNPSFAGLTRDTVAQDTDSASASADAERKMGESEHECAPRVSTEHGHAEPHALEEGSTVASRVAA